MITIDKELKLPGSMQEKYRRRFMCDGRRRFVAQINKL